MVQLLASSMGILYQGRVRQKARASPSSVGATQRGRTALSAKQRYSALPSLLGLTSRVSASPTCLAGQKSAASPQTSGSHCLRMPARALCHGPLPAWQPYLTLSFTPCHSNPCGFFSSSHAPCSHPAHPIFSSVTLVLCLPRQELLSLDQLFCSCCLIPVRLGSRG